MNVLVCVVIFFQGDLVTCGVLSGNKNFEGRLCDCVRANYLASPPLVVAYAIAGTVNIDFQTEPLGMFSSVCVCVRTSAHTCICALFLLEVTFYMFQKRSILNLYYSNLWSCIIIGSYAYLKNIKCATDYSPSCLNLKCPVVESFIY